MDLEPVAGRSDIRRQQRDDLEIGDADELELDAPQHDDGRLCCREAKSEDGKLAEVVVSFCLENERLLVSMMFGLMSLDRMERYDQRRQEREQ